MKKKRNRNIESVQRLSNDYFVIVDGFQIGPIKITEVSELFLNKTIFSDTLYWTKGLSDWMPIGSLYTSRAVYGAFPMPPRKEKIEGLMPAKKANGIALRVFRLFGSFYSTFFSFYKSTKVKSDNESQTNQNASSASMLVPFSEGRRCRYCKGPANPKCCKCRKGCGIICRQCFTAISSHQKTENGCPNCGAELYWYK